MPLCQPLALLKIRPDEARMAAVVAFFFGLIDLNRAVGESAADALFFRRFGVEYLPYMFIMLGIITFGASFGYAVFLGRYEKRSYFPSLMLIMAILLLAERAAISLDLRELYPILWLSVNVIGSLLGILVWTTASEVCDTRQAKRLFPIFVSASILGGLLGSLIIGPTAHLLGTDNLILLCGLLLMAGSLHIRNLARNYFRVTSEPHKPSTFFSDIRVGFEYIRHTPLLQLLAVSAVLFSILYFSVSFPFGRAVSSSFTNEADLAGFLGLFKGVSSALMFVVALVIANRIYTKIGIVSALLILPITYLFGFVLFAAYFSLASAVIVRLAQIVVLSGIGDGAYSAFFNVVPPERRAQVRAFDSGVPTQVGTILSGVLLILGDRLISNTAIFMMGMVVALMCAFVVWRMRRSYVDALVAALHAGRIDAFTEGGRIFTGLANDLDASRTLTSALYDPKPIRQQMAAEMLLRIGATSAVPVLVARLTEVSTEVRAVFARALGKLADQRAAQPVAALLRDGSPLVRAAALEALPSLYNPPDPKALDMIRSKLTDQELSVRIQAAISLGRSGEVPIGLQALVDFMRGSQDEHQRIDLLRAFEQVFKTTHPTSEEATLAAIAVIVQYLQDESPAVRLAACQALAGVSTEIALKALIERLSDPAPEVRVAAARSLWMAGSVAVPFVLAELQTALYPEFVLEALPAGDASIGEALRNYARAEIMRLREWLEACQAIPREGSVTRFLRFLLETKAIQAEQHLTKVIGLLGNETVMGLVARTLGTSDSDARAAAVEALDTLGDKQLVQAFLPLLETSSTKDKPNLDRDGQTEGLIRKLMAGEDPWLRAVAIRAVGELGLKSLLPEVQQFATQNESLASEAALETIRQIGGAVETLPTLSLVERTILLKDIPLFSDLSPDDLVQIAHIAQERWYTDGTTLFHEGENGDEMFIVAEGQVRVTKQVDGKEQFIATRQVGEFVGEMAIIDSGPRYAEVSALGDTRVLVIGSEMFKAILRDRPEVSFAVMRGLSRRLREKI